MRKKNKVPFLLRLHPNLWANLFLLIFVGDNQQPLLNGGKVVRITKRDRPILHLLCLYAQKAEGNFEKAIVPLLVIANSLYPFEKNVILKMENAEKRVEALRNKIKAIHGGESIIINVTNENIRGYYLLDTGQCIVDIEAI